MIVKISDIKSNWKTTVLGVFMFAVTLSFLMGRISLETYAPIMGVIAAGGLVVAGDAQFGSKTTTVISSESDSKTRLP